jgi:hypothetical protein
MILRYVICSNNTKNIIKLIGDIIIFITSLHHIQCVIAAPQPISGIPAGLRIQNTRAVLCYRAVS